MATITLDAEALRLLAAEKRKGETFSAVIKRRFRLKRTRTREHTARELLKNLSKIDFSEEMLDNVDRIITARNESLTNSPILDSEE